MKTAALARDHAAPVDIDALIGAHQQAHSENYLLGLADSRDEREAKILARKWEIWGELNDIVRPGYYHTWINLEGDIDKPLERETACGIIGLCLGKDKNAPFQVLAITNNGVWVVVPLADFVGEVEEGFPNFTFVESYGVAEMLMLFDHEKSAEKQQVALGKYKHYKQTPGGVDRTYIVLCTAHDPNRDRHVVVTIPLYHPYVGKLMHVRPVRHHHAGWYEHGTIVNTAGQPAGVDRFTLLEPFHSAIEAWNQAYPDSFRRAMVA